MFILLANSCAAVVQTTVGPGMLLTDIVEAGAVTSNPVGTKVGTSTATNVMGWVATGDASVNTAAKNGGITKISHVDIKKTNILGIFATSTTLVYGE